MAMPMKDWKSGIALKISTPQKIDNGITTYLKGATNAASACLHVCEIKKPLKALDMPRIMNTANRFLKYNSFWEKNPLL